MEVFDDRDEILVRYLHNELSKEENEELEDEMVLDPGLSERAEAVGAKLIDAYVLGEMSATEKARFEKGFLILPEYREKVEDARTFHEALRARRRESVPAPVPEPARPGWLAALLRLPAPALAFAALVLIAAIVGGLLFIGRRGSRDVVSGNSNGQGNVARQVNAQAVDNRNEGQSQNAQQDGGNTPANNGANNASQPQNPELANGNTNAHKHVAVSIKENNGRVNGTTMGSGGNVRPRLIEIPADAKSFTLTVKLGHRDYFEESLDCSVDVTNSNSTRRLYPIGKYLNVKAKPVGGQYHVSLNIPTAILKEGELYYFRVSEINSQTPFKVKFTN